MIIYSPKENLSVNIPLKTMYIRLNDTFVVRNEKNCSFLVFKRNLLDENFFKSSIISLPPFIGYIFANIGNNEYEQSKKTIAKELNVNEDSIDVFVKKLVNSKERELKLHDGTVIYFPENVLIESDKQDERFFISVDEFNPTDDFVIHRPQIPLNLNFMITTRCTTNCIYCYAQRDLGKDLTTNEAINIIKMAKDSGVVNISLTGGDIFARDDWKTILFEIKKCGYDSFLSTKTPLLYDDIKFLYEIGFNKWQFSLDTKDRKHLNQLVAVKNDYIEQVEQMLSDCDKIGVKIAIRTVLTKINSSIDEVKELYELLKSHSCIMEWSITPAFFSEFKRDYKSYEVNNDDLVDVYNFTKKEKTPFPVILNKIGSDGYKLKRHKSAEEFVRRNTVCHANVYIMSILATGDCTVCEMLYKNPEFLLGNLKENTLIEIWNSPKAYNLYKPKQQNLDSQKPCYSCKVFDACKRSIDKRICYADISKMYGKNIVDTPDPKCPMAPDVDYIL